jgi:maltokinase
LDEEALTAFVTRRRWYGSRQLAATSAHIVAATLVSDDPVLSLAIVQVDFQGGTHELYQLMLGLRSQNGPSESTIWAGTGDEIYEAYDDPDALPALLAHLRASAAVGDGPTVEFRSAVGVDRLDPLPTGARTAGHEQTNSSAIFDERMILKAYRRLQAGVNPELEMLRFLADHDFAHTPALLGWYEHRGNPLDATLGIVQQFVPNARDGWEYVTEALRDGRSDDVLPEIGRLGTITGRLHATLAAHRDDPAFIPEEVRPEGLALMCASLDEVASEVFATLPDEPQFTSATRRRDDLHDRLQRVSKSTGLGRKIRVHGDLHLGQALLGDDGWHVIDFEGEPARPVNERRRKRSPLRDVAGLTRSLDYAVSATRLFDGVDVPATWLTSARGALLDGYMTEVEPTGLLPPTGSVTEELLGLYELEKAVYELRYELAHRPDWAAIPAAAIDTLLGEAA